MNPKKKLLFFVVAAVALAAIAVIVLYSAPHRQLILADDETGAVIARFPLEEGGSFSVTFRHSVNLSDATDIYEIRGGKIFATKTRYSAFGAGMPTDIPVGQRIEYEDGFMVIHGIDAQMHRLCYVIGTVYDHVLEINGELINLTQLCGRNRAVIFKYIK